MVDFRIIIFQKSETPAPTPAPAFPVPFPVFVFIATYYGIQKNSTVVRPGSG